MAYADTIRVSTATINDVADSIEGIFTSTFPATWSSWTPTYSASGSMTFTTVTTQYGRYLQIGKLVFFQLWASGTTGGTANTTISATLPIAAAATVTVPIAATVFDATYSLGLAFATNAGVVDVSKSAGGNWALGASKSIFVGGFYEAA